MVSSFLDKNLPELHLDILPPSTRKAFMMLAEQGKFLKENGWYLAGGTAFALQVGHRSSVDLDFFVEQKDFNIEDIDKELTSIGLWESTLKKQGTLYGNFLKAKTSFIAYPFFKPSPDKLNYKNIFLIKPDDIAVMKIIAISQRGRKRDFVDLYWYCNNAGSLESIFSRLPEQYPQQHNFNHILKSLTYFDDAEGDPTPNVNFMVTWPQIKSYFRREVPILTRKLLGL